MMVALGFAEGDKVNKFFIIFFTMIDCVDYGKTIGVVTGAASVDSIDNKIVSGGPLQGGVHPQSRQAHGPAGKEHHWGKLGLVQ